MGNNIRLISDVINYYDIYTNKTEVYWDYWDRSMLGHVIL